MTAAGAIGEKPKVSVVIVNWNGAHHLRICLPSLREQTCQPLEIIVVDNGSKDESAEIARQYGARWLAVGKNAGLAPGLNRGAADAEADFLLFVNNDMRFDSNFVSALLKPFEEDEEIFATDGMQFNWDGTEKGHLAVRMARKRPADPSTVEIVPGLYFFQQEAREQSPVFMASAACMLARKTLFAAIGGFDDRLPLGYEDTEICWRAWLHGWKTVYVPSAVCWHRVGSSGRSIEGQLFNFRGILTGRLLLAMKFLPARYIVGTWVVSTAALARDLAKLKFVFAKARVKVLAQSAALSGALFRERKMLFAQAKIGPEKHLEHLLGLTDQNAGG